MPEINEPAAMVVRTHEHSDTVHDYLYSLRKPADADKGATSRRLRLQNQSNQTIGTSRLSQGQEDAVLSRLYTAPSASSQRAHGAGAPPGQRLGDGRVRDRAKMGGRRQTLNVSEHSQMLRQY